MKRLMAILGLVDARDVHFYGGAALVAFGGWQVYEPAAFIAPGLLFVFVALRRS